MAAPRFINELTAATSLSAGAALAAFQSGETLRATPRQAVREGGDRYNVLDYIPISLHASIKARTNTTDLTAYIQAAMDDAFANNKRLLWPAGTYRVDTSLDFTSATTTVIEMVGDGEVVIDGTNSTVATLIRLGGTVGDSAALSSDVGPDVLVITSTVASSLAAGNVVLIEDTRTWSGESASYTHGEFCEVESTSGNDIRLKAPLYDNYVAATSTVYLYNMPRVVIRNIKIARASNHQGLEVIRARDIHLEDVSVTGARERGIEIEKCYGGMIDNCRATDVWFSGTGTSYGLAVVSCQNIDIIGGKYFGGRHGIAMGGANFPSRAICVIGAHVSNDRQATQRAFNLHDVTEHITVKGCHIYGGFAGSIRNFIWEGNTVLSGPSKSAFSAGIWGSIDFCIIKNNYHESVTAGQFGLEIEFSENNASIDKIDISGNTITGGGSGVIIDPNSKTGISVDEFVCNGNIVETTGAAFALGGSGTALTVDSGQIIGGKYQCSGNISFEYRPDSASRSLRVIGVHFKATGAFRPYISYLVKHQIVAYCKHEGSGAATNSAIIDAENSSVVGNYLYNMASNGGFTVTVSALGSAVAVIRDNALDTVTGTPAVGAGVTLGYAVKADGTVVS